MFIDLVPIGLFIIIIPGASSGCLIPIFLGFKSKKKFRQIRFPYLIRYAFIFLGIASIFEMVDHISTDFIYIDYTSIFNWLFYTFLAGVLSFFTISVPEGRSVILLILLLLLATTASYWLFGQSTSFFLVIISILLTTQWWKRFKDWLFFIHTFSAVFLTTIFGSILSGSGEQVWHLFICTSGTISALALYLVL